MFLLLRVVFDTAASVNQSLVLKQAGGDYSIRIGTNVINGEIQESNYAKVPPATYELVDQSDLILDMHLTNFYFQDLHWRYPD